MQVTVVAVAVGVGAAAAAMCPSVWRDLLEERNGFVSWIVGFLGVGFLAGV